MNQIHGQGLCADPDSCSKVTGPPPSAAGTSKVVFFSPVSNFVFAVRRDRVKETGEFGILASFTAKTVRLSSFVSKAPSDIWNT